MEPLEISADNFPINNDLTIRLLTVEEVKKAPKGTKLTSIVGDVIEVGKNVLDLETTMFKRSKYGIPVIKGKLVHVSGKTQPRPYKKVA